MHKKSFTLGRLSVLLVLLAAVLSVNALSGDEISLFDFKGRATAYISEDQTIYLWQGKPVAYLNGEEKEGSDG
jgi:hypothetical protein